MTAPHPTQRDLERRLAERGERIAFLSGEVRRLTSENASLRRDLDECDERITQLRLQCEAYERAGLERIDRRGAW